MQTAAPAILVLGLVASTLGCAAWKTSIPDPQQRLARTQSLARRAGFESIEPGPAPADTLPVAAWIRRGSDPSNLHVYIEGDGLAWQARRRVSDDPTPIEPTGLQLAALDPSNATVVYLGRPCQYRMASGSRCRALFWTAARYGEAVVEAMDHRIDGLLAKRWDEPRVSLVGYSGGGVVAALVAARRGDIEMLVTIASPLDVRSWTRRARVSPLLASLSPMDQIDALRSVPQRHFVGRDDSVVPLAVTAAFHRAMLPRGSSRLVIIDGMDHRAWPGAWTEIVRANRLFDDAPAIPGWDPQQESRE